MLPIPAEPVALLCSGGVESAALAFLCSRRTSLQPIYVRFGLIWEEAEVNSLRAFLKAIANPNLRPLALLDEPVSTLYRNHWSVTGADTPGADDPDESVYLPGRNLLLLAKAAVFCSLERLSILLVGTLQGNPFPDARLEFFAGMARAISLALGDRFEVLAPFQALRKEDVIRLAAAAPLELSFSCIHPLDSRHCGRCNKCGERRKHFSLAGITDKTVYAGH